MSVHTSQLDDTTSQSELAGIVEGTDVLTMRGYLPITELKAGDRIITRRGVRVLHAITAQTVKMKAIRIGKSALGFSKPAGELVVVPGQEIRVHDWRAQALFGKESIVLPVERLIDDNHITQDEDASEHRLYEMQFETAEVIYVDGVEMVAGVKAASLTEAELVEFA